MYLIKEWCIRLQRNAYSEIQLSDYVCVCCSSTEYEYQLYT